MRKALFLLMLPSLCFATGAKYIGTTTDRQVYQEFQNAYKDISSLSDRSHDAVKFATVTVSNISGIWPAPNPVINAGMESWQLGTSFSSPLNDAYVADCWQIQTGGGTPATYTVSRDGANADTGLYALSMNVTNAGSGITNSLRIQQKFENYYDYAGQTISISVRIKTTIANKVRFVLDLGDSGTFSPYHTGSGNYETLSITKAVPANVGLMWLKIGMTSADIVTGQYYIDSVMLSISSGTPTYVMTPPALDRLRISRFIQVGGNSSDAFFFYGQGYSDGTNYYIGGSQRFSPPMASTPTITITGNNLSEDGSAVNVIGGYTVEGILPDANGFLARARKAVGGSRPSEFSFYWTAQVFL